MGASGVIFSGNSVKALKQNFNLNGQVYILSGTTDPSSVATSAPQGSLYLNTSNSNIYRKTDNGSSTNWLILSSAATGDIGVSSFSALNNTANQDVTGLSFNTSTIRAFESLVSVSIVGTASTFERFTLNGIYNGTSWDMSQTSNGDITGATFAITNAGQIQISTPNTAGFVSCTVKFRAIALPQ